MIVVLRTNWKERRERLQTSFDKEEWRTCSSADDTRGSTSKDIDTQRLDLGVLIDRCCESLAQGFVES